MKYYLLLVALFLFSCNQKQQSQDQAMNKALAKTIEEKTGLQRNLSENNKSKSGPTFEKMTFEEMVLKAEELGIQKSDSIQWKDLIDAEFDLPIFLEYGIPFFIRECGSPNTYIKAKKKYFNTSKNVYTIVTEDFNYEESSFHRALTNLERITDGQLKFTDIKPSNLGQPENVPILLDLKINGVPFSYKLKLNNGHFDKALLESICQTAQGKGIPFSYWSQDGLSYTVFGGTQDFQKNIQEYLGIEACGN